MAPIIDELTAIPPSWPPVRNGSRTAGVVATYVSIALTIGGLIFTAGYNYRGVAEVQSAQDKLSTAVMNDYARKDVVDAKLDEIKAQLATLQRAIERQGK